jgi:uncharacterized protein YktB (UPF0637 family)
MATKGESAVMVPLAQSAETVGFLGFTPQDFDVFLIEGYAERMPLVRAQIKPKLMQIGAALSSRLSDILGEEVFPHVAQHLRRTVNPPEETWVAFARIKRAYKPVVHLRVAISAEKVRVTAFCEDYADDKETFAQNLAANADTLACHFAHHPHILAYEICDKEGAPLRGHALTADILRDFAARMNRVKGQHAVFGIAFSRDHPIVQNGPEFLDAIVTAATTLKPLYDCGK